MGVGVASVLRPITPPEAMSWEAQLQVLGEVALAMLLGGLIGLEREAADKPAGLRTHMLVAGAAALLVGLGGAMVRHFATTADGDLIRGDPIRVIEAIIGGISFLGAGTILHRRADRVEGLTTAASILFAAAIGIAVALLQLVLAVGATTLALGVLRGLHFLDRRIGSPHDDEPDGDGGEAPPGRASANGRRARPRG
jgi:putative Mg2+ transporter-C (MgtC) family protein